MVSPCKDDDSQNKNVRYCFPGNNKSPKNTAVKAPKSVSRRSRIKPLANRIFYLDLKSRKDSEYLDTTLKSFGATVAIFLDRSVTHIISDRPASGPGSSTLASPAASVSPYLSHSPSPSDRSLLPRSRGAAMLERVSSTAYTGYIDPITFAQQWQVPVLSPGKIRAELSAIEKSSKGKVRKLRQAKGDFVKLESLTGSWKPDLLCFERWPVLDLDSPAGELPFQWGDGHGLTPTVPRGDSTPSITMTRRPYKNSSNSEDDATVGAVNKKKTLCNGHGPVKPSSPDDLRVQCNGLNSGIRNSKLLSPSGSDVLPLPTQRRSTRRASASWCGSTRELSQLSPPLSPQLGSPSSPSDSELGVTLRPKGTLWLPVALIGTTAEEHGNCIRRRGGSDASLNSLDASKPRRKKLSPEEKLLQDNKDYFKMEVLNTKLRSSGPKQSNHVNANGKLSNRCKRGRWAKTKESVEDEQDYENVDSTSPLIKVNGVQKTKRSRQSELTTLCDEAETFMFGESSRQSAPSAVESEEETRRDKEGTSSNEGRPRKKRRSHAEAFIHDNLDYYKFETPGSRLRSQGSVVGELEQNKTAEKHSELIFSFEAVPSTEPWYDVFRRQDEGNEIQCPVISDPANQLFLLPYELPKSLHPRLDARDYYVKRRLRLAHIVGQNHPRKSPRCHASTLAILSSLKRRKRRSSANVAPAEPDASPSKDDILSQLDCIIDEPFEEIPLLDPGDVEPAATTATTARRKKTEERLVLHAVQPVTIGPQPADVMALVNSYWDSPKPDLLNTTPNASNHRRPRRRRKARFNKTGWDKAKSRARKAQRAQQATGVTSNKKTATPSPKRSANGSPAVTVPCVVRVRKLSHSYCRKLSMKRRRRRSGTDYSWTTRKR